jgi:hypothetical protein
MDVVASVWVEPRVRFGNPGIKRWASIVCLEQKSSGEFVRHTLVSDFPWYATLEMADFDQDGDLDLAFGPCFINPSLQPPDWLEVWWNQGVRSRSSPTSTAKDSSG